MPGKGIVTLAGGEVYGTNAYLTCRLLRHHGCSLPVEWFYLPGESLPPCDIEGVTYIPLDYAKKDTYCKGKGGWQNKPVSIQRSSFDEVLFMDADCFAERNPEYLFNEPIYKDKSALYWLDIGVFTKTEKDYLQKYFNVRHDLQRCFESGQMLINKTKNKMMLNLCVIYNQTPQVYKILLGDKDTFFFAHKITSSPFGFVNVYPKIGQGYLIQHDMQGRIAFRHLTGAKWYLQACKPTVEPTFPNCDLLYAWLEELRRKEWTLP